MKKKNLLFLVFFSFLVVGNKNIFSQNPDSIPFAPAVNYKTGATPYQLFVSDVDGDGDQDLAVANLRDNTVSIFRNKGNGNFTARVDYSTGDAPAAVFASDLDGDGDMDLAVPNLYGGTVSILKNNGDGTFVSGTDYVTGYGCTFVTASDLDRDGDQDLATVNYGDNSTTCSVLMNNGDGSFATRVDYQTGNLPRYVVASDLDADSYPDLAVANEHGQSVSVLRNNGDGTFAAKVDYQVGSSPVSFLAADLDGDGDLDLVVDNAGSNTVLVLKNSGDGTFATKDDFATGLNPLFGFVSDLDGDGDGDVITPNANVLSGNTISILRNKGDGTLAASVNYATGKGPWAVFASDLDGDGDQDLVVINYGSNTVSVLRNSTLCPGRAGDANADFLVSIPDLIFMVNYILKDGTVPSPLCLVDANADGMNDIQDIVYLTNYLFRGGSPPLKSEVRCL